MGGWCWRRHRPTPRTQEVGSAVVLIIGLGGGEAGAGGAGRHPLRSMRSGHVRLAGQAAAVNAGSKEKTDLGQRLLLSALR